MVNDIKFSLSEHLKAKQIQAISDRFGSSVSNIRSVPLNSYADIFQQIDVKADDNFSGGNINFQLKCRSSDKDDICFKVKELFGQEKNGIGFSYTVNNDTRYYVFPPEFTNSQYFVFSRGDKFPLIMPTQNIVRIFYRYRNFTPADITITDYEDKFDTSARLLFISPEKMTRLLVQDFLIILKGFDYAKNILSKIEN